MTRLYHYLLTVHPLAPWAVVTLLSFAAVYSVRRWLPAVWLKFESIIPEGGGKPLSRVLQALPAAAFGAAFGALYSGEAVPVSFAFFGTIAGALSPFVHHLLRWLPVPYQGPVRDRMFKRIMEILKRMGAGAVFFVIGCSGANYELCRAEARAKFHADADKCQDETCVDALSEREAADLKECR